jgi:hypothetical protein
MGSIKGLEFEPLYKGKSSEWVCSKTRDEILNIWAHIERSGSSQNISDLGLIVA